MNFEIKQYAPLCALLAAHSYHRKINVIRSSINKHITYEGFIDIGDTQVILGTQNETRIAVFRGVELDRVNDLKSALNFGPQLKEFGVLHAGFEEALNLVWSELIQWIGPNREIVFTGHSMGGALAQIAAARYYIEKGIYPKTIVFGAPRIGEIHNIPPQLHPLKYSLVGDPIPFLPMNWMGPYKEKSRKGFHLVYPDGRIKIEPPYLLHRVLTWRSLLAKPWKAPRLAWERHSAMAYAKALSNN